jgi:hypothetical protein
VRTRTCDMCAHDRQGSAGLDGSRPASRTTARTSLLREGHRRPTGGRGFDGRGPACGLPSPCFHLHVPEHRGCVSRSMVDSESPDELQRRRTNRVSHLQGAVRPPAGQTALEFAFADETRCRRGCTRARRRF